MLGGVWVRAWLSSTQLFGDTTCIKDVWKPAIGEKLHAEQGPDNAVGKFAMKVEKTTRDSLYVGV